jgi:bifunctional pyridoxal-dependent enzyme with beta-cystathionase and maltose regulon repressor activities
MVKMCGARPVPVPTRAEDGYVLTASVLKDALQAHPKATCIILCNPSNPTGAVAAESVLRECATVLEAYPKVGLLTDLQHTNKFCAVLLFFCIKYMVVGMLTSLFAEWLIFITHRTRTPTYALLAYSLHVLPVYGA